MGESKGINFSNELKNLLEKHKAEMFIYEPESRVPIICVKFIRPKRKTLVIELGYHFDKDWEI
jgi:hypothetical protein